MGGRGTFAAGNNVDYRYSTVDRIEDVKVLQGLGGLHDLPMESHSSDMYIKLKPDGSFHELRMYSENHLALLDIDYHVEAGLGISGEPVLHYHTYEYGSQFKNGMHRSKALPITQELYEKFKKYLKGIKL